MILDFTVKEHERLNDRFMAWKTEHYKTCQYRGDSFGCLYSFRILPSGIGTFVTVHCPCGVEYELSESKNF